MEFLKALKEDKLLADMFEKFLEEMEEVIPEYAKAKWLLTNEYDSRHQFGEAELVDGAFSVEVTSSYCGCCPDDYEGTITLTVEELINGEEILSALAAKQQAEKEERKRQHELKVKKEQEEAEKKRLHLVSISAEIAELESDDYKGPLSFLDRVNKINKLKQELK
ncbi:hypothetical protein [Pseudoalteromonas phage J2-1_QLiu-2017]|nr:hypothetical protein [Pseudoalteromonas phage J2-1_QLiu-2017]